MSTLEDLNATVVRVKAAQRLFANFSQEKVDAIFKKAALAASNQRIALAKLAVEETGRGLLEDKVIKNHFASEEVYHKYASLKTCGIIELDDAFGYRRVAKPVGLLAGIIPVTNPTSTAIFKALIALKTRNGIIFSPHPNAKLCTIAAAKVVLQAAVEAGAPEGIIGWIEEPTLELSQALMQHPDVSLILATGGPSMVHAACSSGNPSLGVGSGNTPALIDDSADIEMAVSSILISKTFDNGMICASEQSVVVIDTRYEAVKAEFAKRGAYFLSEDEKQKVSAIMLLHGHLNADIVGQSVSRLAEMAGIIVPEGARILIAEVEDIGTTEVFSYEKISLILAMYRAKDFDDGLDKAKRLIEFGGLGHTAVIYADSTATHHITAFREALNVCRVLINTPSSQGAIGDLYNFRLAPSLTLGCGTWGGGVVSGNVGPLNLLNIQVIADRRDNMLWYRVPSRIYFKPSCLPTALQDIKGLHRAFIVTDKPIFDLGMVQEIRQVLEQLAITFKIFYDIEPSPTLSAVTRGLEEIRSFQPDVIIAFGGGSPMDAAKIMWLLYEHPEVEFAGMAARFMDMRKRVYELPPLGNKAILIAIPTTSGSGSEVTPFAVVTDDRTGIQYPLADYSLTPSIAIIDSQLVMQLPKGLTAYGGIDALTHALEALVSSFASNFTTPSALEAMRLLFKYLPAAYHEGEANPKARERVHYAATIAGTAFANAFLGICHSLAHQLESTFHIPHGLANALMLTHVIRYNATDHPFRQASFSQYHYPSAKGRYSTAIDYLRFSSGDSKEDKIELLITKVEWLKQQVGIPPTLKEALPQVSEANFLAAVDRMAEQALDDQCTGTNPRAPLLEDLKRLYLAAYYDNAETF
jgi:acetaldehyde dehydrogenase/alcohol dehydrogenase